MKIHSDLIKALDRVASLLAVIWRQMEESGWSSSVGSMALSTSIAIGLTMCMALEIWRENFSTDWKNSTASPHTR